MKTFLNITYIIGWLFITASMFAGHYLDIRAESLLFKAGAILLFVVFGIDRYVKRG